MALDRRVVTRVLHELDAVLRPEGFRRTDRTFVRSTSAGLLHLVEVATDGRQRGSGAGMVSLEWAVHLGDLDPDRVCPRWAAQGLFRAIWGRRWMDLATAGIGPMLATDALRVALPDLARVETLDDLRVLCERPERLCAGDLASLWPNGPAAIHLARVYAAGGDLATAQRLARHYLHGLEPGLHRDFVCGLLAAAGIPAP